MFIPICTNGFQSTHPRRVRRRVAGVAVVYVEFQSTHPRRVRLYQEMLCRGEDSFNPRTHVGCDFSFLQRIWDKDKFQSTHPRRVRPFHAADPTALSGFNPRTHVGCDSMVCLLPWQTISFNPRTHVGCDIVSHLTHKRKGVSIHAPT